MNLVCATNLSVSDDKLITCLELKKYVRELNLDEIPMEGKIPTNEIIDIIMRRLDVDGSGDIDQK